MSPADDSAWQHPQLSAKTADKVPYLPAFKGGERSVQPRRAVSARRLAGLAGLAVLLAPAVGPFGKGAKAFFFLFQQQALGHIGQLKRLEDWPDVQERIDGLGARHR